MTEIKDVELTSLIEECLENDIPDITDDKIEKLSEYMEGVLSWNEKVNLTAIKDKKDFVEKHYLDSLRVLELAEYQGAKRVLDLGTGGGFPGVPLAVWDEEKKFVLMDSLAKRLRIIDELTESIGIYNVETIHGRFEDLGKEKEYREKFDAVVSRAVAEMSVLVEYALPFLKAGGKLLAYKTGGEKLDKEIEAAEKAIKILGGELSRTKVFSGDHVIVIINKIKKTPAEYPRKAGTPKKNPL